MNRQISQCSFNVFVQNDTNVATVTGFPVTINVFSGQYAYRPYYYTGSPYDEAINGRLRSQLGGYRFEATLSWERQLNTDPLMALINNGYISSETPLSENISGELIIQFIPDASDSNVVENVVISEVSVQSSIESTIIRQPISISLVGKEVSKTIPSSFML
jgi:hypothetical protein